MNLKPRYPMQFLVALIAAFLLWYALAAQQSENISVRGVQARLTLVNMNRDLVLMSSVPDTVSLQLRGPADACPQARQIHPRSCSISPTHNPASTPTRSTPAISRCRRRSKWSASTSCHHSRAGTPGDPDSACATDGQRCSGARLRYR